MRRADVLWLAGQGVLFVLAFVVVPRADGWFGRIGLPAARPLGWMVFAVGGLITVVAMLQLGRQLAPQPSPVHEGRLIDTGLYGVVRHPIYTGVLLLIAGSVLRVPSLAGALLVVISAVFFDRKIAYEEVLLVEAYDDYDAYRARVRAKLVPGVR
ncbi:MAG TPA: isoprenylcysteine carboxylmethyltransferase family protein [Euzebyales bacterium]